MGEGTVTIVEFREKAGTAGKPKASYKLPYMNGQISIYLA